jgi:hypothetical protein
MEVSVPTTEGLVSEISQIMEQYRREVPSKRSRVPESVRERVVALHGLGLNFREISRKTGLPYFTVIKWKPKKGGAFEPMRITNGKSNGLISEVATVTVAKRKRRRVAMVTKANEGPVSVVFANGTRIEGLNAEMLSQILPSLGRCR